MNAEAKVVTEQRWHHHNAVQSHSSLAYLTPVEFKQRYSLTDAPEAVLQDLNDPKNEAGYCLDDSLLRHANVGSQYTLTA